MNLLLPKTKLNLWETSRRPPPLVEREKDRQVDRLKNNLNHPKSLRLRILETYNIDIMIKMGIFNITKYKENENEEEIEDAKINKGLSFKYS